MSHVRRAALRWFATLGFAYLAATAIEILLQIIVSVVAFRLEVPFALAGIVPAIHVLTWLLVPIIVIGQRMRKRYTNGVPRS